MDENLNRVFEQIRPSREQKEAMLSRLLESERKSKPMKKLKKLTVLAVAAALMILSCAAAVVTGIDQRILEYFGAGPEQAELLAKGVIPVGERHTYDSGWTVEIVQLASDRYSIVALAEVTAPEGVRLDGDYHVEFNTKLAPKDGEGIGSYVSGSFQLPDENPEDNRFTILWHRGPTSFLKSGTQEVSGRRLTLIPQRIWQDFGDLRVDFPKDEWSVTVELPAEDSGTAYTLNQTVTAGGETVVVDEVYISPVSMAYHMTGYVAGERLFLPPEFSDWEERTAVYTTDGNMTAAKEAVSISHNPKDGSGMFVFRLEGMIDPAQAAGVMIFGQNLPLDGLLPVE